MLTIHWQADSHVPIEAECLAPERLEGKSPQEIGQIPVFHGNRAEPLETFCSIEGSADDGRVLIEGDCRRVKWIGAEMHKGAFAGFALIAAPKFLGLLRQELAVATKAEPWVTINKDVVGQRETVIEELLGSALREQ